MSELFIAILPFYQNQVTFCPTVAGEFSKALQLNVKNADSAESPSSKTNSIPLSKSGTNTSRTSSSQMTVNLVGRAEGRVVQLLGAIVPGDDYNSLEVSAVGIGKKVDTYAALASFDVYELMMMNICSSWLFPIIRSPYMVAIATKNKNMIGSLVV